MNSTLRNKPLVLPLLALALLFPLSGTARAGISGASVTNNSSADDDWITSSYAQGRASTAAITADDGATLTTRYAFSVGAWNDSSGTMSEALTSNYTIEFTVTAPGDYEVQVDQIFDATAQTISYSAYGTATIGLTTLAGSQTGGTLDSGSLGLSYGSISNTTGYNESPPMWSSIYDTNTAVITGTSNGSPITHTLTFSWTSDCESEAYSIFYPDGDHCGVRGGISTGFGNSATDYSTDPGTVADDGHVVTITLTELAGPDLCAGVVCNNGDQCNDDGACNPSDGTCSAATPVADTTSCDDGDGSTTSDQCTSGTCAGVDLCDGVVCNNGDQCNDNGTCDPSDGTCSAATPVADATSCDDGDGSTTSDQCTSGTCAGVNLCAGVVCSNGDQCNDNGTCDPFTGSCGATTPVADATSCDDANSLTSGESCSAGVCACGDGVSTPACTVNCGDGTTDSGEACDDGNNLDGDGCSASCESEAAFCGDSAVEDDEECDDGNTDEHDGCSSRCQDEADQSKDQQKCLGSQVSYIGKIIKTQAKENATCVKNAGKGKLDGQTLDECLTADNKGKVAKVETKLTTHQTDPDKGKCLSEPDFAYVAAADFVAAAVPEQIAFMAATLGSDAAATVVDATDKANKNASKCQAMLLKLADKTLQTRLKVFGICLKKELKAKEDGDRIVSTVTAEGCWGEGADKVAKAVIKAAELNVKKCDEKGVVFTDVIAGDCTAAGDETAYAECIDERAACRACRILNGTLDLELACDELDDDVLNDSCGATEGSGAGSPRGAFVDGPIIL
ncbi:MAG: DUF4215 domain-containing protein [Deltaproteobacteria bacterium]